MSCGVRGRNQAGVSDNDADTKKAGRVSASPVAIRAMNGLRIREVPLPPSARLPYDVRPEGVITMTFPATGSRSASPGEVPRSRLARLRVLAGPVLPAIRSPATAAFGRPIIGRIGEAAHGEGPRGRPSRDSPSRSGSRVTITEIAGLLADSVGSPSSTSARPPRATDRTIRCLARTGTRITPLRVRR